MLKRYSVKRSLFTKSFQKWIFSLNKYLTVIFAVFGQHISIIQGRYFNTETRFLDLIFDLLCLIIVVLNKELKDEITEKNSKIFQNF